MGNAANVDVKLSLFELTMLQKELQGAIFGGLNPRAAIPELLASTRRASSSSTSWSPRRTPSRTSTRATRTCATARTSAAMIVYTDADR